MGSLEAAKEMGVHCSSFGEIPKRNKKNKWCLILDLLSPEGCSINDGIQKQLASLFYVSIDDVVEEVLRKGKG